MTDICIRDNCGRPFEPVPAWTRARIDLAHGTRAFWWCYCPLHRQAAPGYGEPIFAVEAREESTDDHTSI